MKVTVVGAGNVGATLAMRILESNLADVVLVDKLENVAKGKALDLSDAQHIIGHNKTIIGTGDYSHAAGSEAVVITAGFPRKPGMTREELVTANASIVKEVISQVKCHCREAIVIVVTNPLDAMTYLACKTSGFEPRRVIGMAGVLDESRMKYQIASELKVPPGSIEVLVLGSHGDTMVPLLSIAKVKGRHLASLLPKDKLDKAVRVTRERGAEIVSLLGSGSAYYSPSAGAFRMVEAVLKDTRELMTASVYLNGEYGLKDICIGVPARIGRKGVEKVIEVDLTDEERKALHKSADAVRGTVLLG